MMTCTILLVDDDPVVRTLLQKRLLNNGYDVTTAVDGNEALNLLRSSHYQVVITDLIMPGGIDGIDLLEEVKKLYSDTEVILITGHNSIEKAVEAMKKGAVDYLEKPVNIDELFLRLDKIEQISSLVRNAGDLRDAMDTSLHSAAETIQQLELTAFELRCKIETIESIVCDTSIGDDRKKLQLISDTLKA